MFEEETTSHSQTVQKQIRLCQLKLSTELSTECGSAEVLNAEVLMCKLPSTEVLAYMYLANRLNPCIG